MIDIGKKQETVYQALKKTVLANLKINEGNNYQFSSKSKVWDKFKWFLKKHFCKTKLNWFPCGKDDHVAYQAKSIEGLQFHLNTSTNYNPSSL